MFRSETTLAFTYRSISPVEALHGLTYFIFTALLHAMLTGEDQSYNSSAQ